MGGDEGKGKDTRAGKARKAIMQGLQLFLLAQILWLGFQFVSGSEVIAKGCFNGRVLREEIVDWVGSVLAIPAYLLLVHGLWLMAYGHNLLRRPAFVTFLFLPLLGANLTVAHLVDDYGDVALVSELAPQMDKPLLDERGRRLAEKWHLGGVPTDDDVRAVVIEEAIRKLGRNRWVKSWPSGGCLEVPEVTIMVELIPDYRRRDLFFGLAGGTIVYVISYLAFGGVVWLFRLFRFLRKRWQVPQTG